MTTRTTVPKWLRVAWVTYLGIAAYAMVAYYAGAPGFRIGQTGTSHTYTREGRPTFVIDGRYALRENDNAVSLVVYEPAPLPFRPACGTYEVVDELIPVVDVRQGDWFLTRWPWPGHAVAVNVRTNATIVYEGPPLDGPVSSAEAIPALAAAGLGFDGGQVVDYASVSGTHAVLDCMDEDCVVQLCGLFTVGLLLLGLTGIVIMVRRRRG